MAYMRVTCVFVYAYFSEGFLSFFCVFCVFCVAAMAKRARAVDSAEDREEERESKKKGLPSHIKNKLLRSVHYSKLKHEKKKMKARRRKERDAAANQALELGEEVRLLSPLSFPGRII
jgi:hypothetical protein